MFIEQYVNVHQAKTHLSQIIEQVKVSHQPIVIAKSGVPQVKIVSLEQIDSAKRFGFAPDIGEMPEDFDTRWNKEIEMAFFGE